MKLDTHTRHLPGPGVLQGQEERWDEWEEILERVRDGNEDHDGESSRRDILLIFKVAVGGHERPTLASRMSRSSGPFFSPAQPRSCTVVTSWPTT